ncbi:hypothetical protein ABRY23_10405 [Melioribacteraceae bacterium 4301-Me]|uniref:hypothetical protein n=1 Tax=Pyranulibacter aquaticus TaxID=3163344 RepID=UPI003594BD56
MEEKSHHLFIKFSLLLIMLITSPHLITTAQSSFNLSSPNPLPPSSGTSWLIGGRIGMSIGSGGGSTSAGFQIGPMGEVLFGKGMAVGTELNINTQSGTPIEWADYFKYYFDIPGSTVKPYVNGGLSLWFVSGGPYFGIRIGGGANFKVANNLYIPADLQFGPVFFSEKTYDWWTGQSTSKTNTVFYVAITTGIRYELP